MICPSIFTISLDFELHWGGVEKWPLKNYRSYFDRTRESLPVVLSLFQQQEIHATWAIVGMLMTRDLEELNSNLPQLKPTYDSMQLSAYRYIEEQGIGDNENSDPYHYAHSLVNKIANTPGQEIATHSFAHFYCNESGQTPEQFRADLQSAKAVSKKYVDRLDSLVFPRNQFNANYLKVCADEGLRIARSNPLDWWWHIDSTQSESKLKRLNRGLDAYFGVGGKTSYSLGQVEKREGVYLLPASRLLRPFNPKELFLNQKKIKRIKQEMTRAAENGEVYHLWWHPHNFGNHTQRNIDGLVEIMYHFDYLRKNYTMVSRSMQEILHILNNG